MPVKLLVSNADGDGAPNEHRFEQAPIVIGRASENDLTLPDRKRIVSGQHAEIRKEDDAHHLVDLGSKNFTYLNGERLRSGQRYEVQSGDVFEIGDFEIEFAIAAPAPSVPASAPDPDETVFAADFLNPFDEPAEKLAGALSEIIAAYDREAPSRREDALQAALEQTRLEQSLDEEADHEAVAQVLELLGLEVPAPTAGPNAEERGATPPQDSPPLDQEPGRASSSDVANDAQKAVPSASPSVPDEGATASSEGAMASDARRDALFELLLQSVARLIRIPWQFRHEFIGQTIVQSSDSTALYEGDAEALTEYLLPASLSEEEARERRKRLEEAVDRLLMHQMAMLDGYKASAQTGARQLLSQIDPGAEEEAVAEENKLYDLLPIFGKPVVVRRLKAAHEELQGEDWSVAERRIFRPAFIKAYLARMTASPDAE